ncbi:phosphoribosyltransferase [Pelagibius marinus]|uniref:phosphoribosyltransferase n=1 Tax=Pelagibius marinus TaxID=2762760 RepID=UPI001D059ADA|nr:phosphoribosyltransferase family protein [Pelagibius marinus]
MVMFRDRREAGERLAGHLAGTVASFEDTAPPVVVALPRGGVPVAAAIAARLQAPLDVIIARKIGAPGQPELAIGAVAEGAGGEGAEETVWNRRIIVDLGLREESLEQRRAEKLREVRERAALYRDGRPAVVLEGRSVILVDDGIATGATTEAALRALRRRRPRRIILAVPVAPEDTLARLRRLADDVVCLAQPADFYAIGAYYRDFTQVKDADVIRCLSQYRPDQPEEAVDDN